MPMTSTFGSDLQNNRATTKHRARKGRAAVAAVAAAAGLVLTGAPPAAGTTAFTAHDFFLWGPDRASYFDGTVTFYNRSVGVVGTFHAVGCRRFYASSHAGGRQLDIRSTSTHCNSTTTENISLSADVAGGADRVRVALTDRYGQNGTGGDIRR